MDGVYEHSLDYTIVHRFRIAICSVICHPANVLFDEQTGDCAHVDLNMLFERGSKLECPESVPVRLTHNLVDAIGVPSHRGTFTTTCDITMDVMLHNKDALTSVFKTLFNNWSDDEVIFF